MLAGKKIILGISGSIAAYKSAFLARELMRHGASVKVVMTQEASKFITPLTFFHLTGQPVFDNLWQGDWTEHVHVGREAELLIVAPATANTLAKMANGLCDNALLAVFLSSNCPVLIAPAMDADMYAHPTVIENLDKLRKKGYFIIEGKEGLHASGLEGLGRLAEPEEIVSAAIDCFEKGPLSGKTVLISAGPTQEAIDPVRYLSNHSTGKMGLALADAAQALGANVKLVLGPVHLDLPKYAEIFSVVSAAEMEIAMNTHMTQADVIIMAAAVADFKPAEKATAKIKKNTDKGEIALVPTQDILLGLGKRKTHQQYLCGFALETDNATAHAKRKLSEKNLDLLVLNTLEDAGAGFGHDTNKVSLFDKAGNIIALPLCTKKETATSIFTKILADLSL